MRLRQRPLDLDHHAGQQIELRGVGLLQGLGLRRAIRLQPHRRHVRLEHVARAIGPDGLFDLLAVGQSRDRFDAQQVVGAVRSLQGSKSLADHLHVGHLLEFDHQRLSACGARRAASACATAICSTANGPP